MEAIIRAKNLSKSYDLNLGTHRKQINALISIHFEIFQGDCVGLLGPNGSGKSTLLRLIQGITDPTAGELNVGGSVGSILSISSGMNLELSGRHNCELALGLMKTKSPISISLLEEIESLAQIGDFFEAPVKYYSNGMKLRLAFALVTSLDFDIYMFDEVFSVGDLEFQEKAISKIAELRAEHKTILLASHQLKELQICNRIFSFQLGKLEFDGIRSEGIKRYVSQKISRTGKIIERTPFRIEIDKSQLNLTLHSIELKQNAEGRIRCEEAIEIRLHYSNSNPEYKVWDPVILISDHLGQSIAMSSPVFNRDVIDTKSSEVKISCEIPKNMLGSDLYSISVVFFNNLQHLIQRAQNNEPITWEDHTIFMETGLSIHPQFTWKETSIDMSKMNTMGSLILTCNWHLLP